MSKSRALVRARIGPPYSGAADFDDKILWQQWAACNVLQRYHIAHLYSRARHKYLPSPHPASLDQGL